jgi:hypothetical protein
VAGYKVPRELHVVDEIVRSPSGKPDYRGPSEGSMVVETVLALENPLKPGMFNSTYSAA